MQAWIASSPTSPETNSLKNGRGERRKPFATLPVTSPPVLPRPPSQPNTSAFSSARTHCQPPPWGSVYLDRENCLFGESSAALADFCQAHDIEFASEQHEPPDHFGLVCAIGAILFESGREALVPDFLAVHMLPWSVRFLERFTEATTQSPFYRAAAQLANLTLSTLQEEWQLTPVKHELYA